jgi:hypothetical protein
MRAQLPKEDAERPIRAVDAWPGIEDALKQWSRRAGLDGDAYDAVLHEVLVAVIQKGEFRSRRGAERFAVVVAGRAMGHIRRPPGNLVPLDVVAEEVGSIPADGSDAPEDRAVLRAGFDAILAGIDPPPKAADLRSLWSPTHPPAATPAEQRYWSVRLHRVRKRMAAEVRDLLAPAAFFRRLPRRLRGLAASAGAGGACVAVAILSLAVQGAAGGVPLASPAALRPRPASTAGPAAAGATGVRGSTGAPPSPLVVSRAAPASAPAPGATPGMAVHTNTVLWRAGGAAGVTSKTVIVRYEGRSTRHETRVEVYCTSEVRERVCELVDRFEGVGGPTDVGPPPGSAP